MKDMVKDLRTDMEKQRQAIQAVNDRPLPAPSGPSGGLHDDEILAELRAQVRWSLLRPIKSVCAALLRVLSNYRLCRIAAVRAGRAVHSNRVDCRLN
jgi:hypothetical protein